MDKDQKAGGGATPLATPTEANAAEWKIDKTGWADGPWMQEPDRVEWRGPRGLPCLIVRNRSGALCGYVGVPPGHPWHGKDYNRLYDAEPSPDAHGGLTFAGPCMDGGPVCHVPRHGEPADVWWLGFDHAHSMDFVPSYTKLDREQPDGLWSQAGQTYRNIAYVRHGVESLAQQVIDARLGPPGAAAPTPAGPTEEGT